MFGKGIRLGRIFGITIEIDFSWFIIFFLVAWSLSIGYFPYFYPDIAGKYYWIMGVLAALLLFLSVLLHELSHSYIAIKNDLPISRITLFIFGGVANMTEEPKSPGIEFRVAIAGPICSFSLMFIFGALAKMTAEGSAAYAIFKYVSFINGFLAFFNLVPGFPLDGGRLLRSTFWHFTKDIKKSTLIASNIGKGFAAFLIFMGFFSIMAGSAFNGLWLIFIGFFLQRAAASSYRQVVIKEILADMTVENVMNRRVVSVTDDISVQELVDNFFIPYHFNCFPVQEGKTLIGVVCMTEVKELSRELWREKTVGDIMKKDPGILLISTKMSVENAFKKMLEENIGWLAVTNPDKTVAGILTRSDILHLLEIKGTLGE